MNLNPSRRSGVFDLSGEITALVVFYFVIGVVLFGFAGLVFLARDELPPLEVCLGLVTAGLGVLVFVWGFRALGWF